MLPAPLLNELEAMTERLEQVESDLERLHALATLGTIAGSIAHEFNNILTPMMSYAQMAQQHPEDADLTEKALAKAVEGAHRASEIASCMLGFVRDAPGDAVHIGHAVRDTLACLARPPEKDGIELRVEVDGDAWAAMRPVALQQVLLNLLLNARRAMLPRGGAITIAACRSTWNTAGGETVEVRVADTGPGLPAEVRARVFEPFVPGPASTQARPGRPGTGLGLSICRRLIEQVGGSISVASESGRGTEFVIVLPAAAVPEREPTTLIGD